jgi:ABC-type antimicrobial peptide transport system ATPase subunit
MSEPVSLGEAGAHDALVGQSAVMQAIYKEIGRVASKPVTVLIRGETGTGKELIARAIYQHSEPGWRAVHRRQLRRDSGNLARERIVWARKGRLYRRTNPPHRAI